MERGRQAKAFRRAAAGAPALAGRQDRIPHAQGGPATRVRAAPEPAIIAELQRIIDASVVASITGGMTFLVTEYGKPFTSSGFGNKLRAWCEEAELYGLSAHRVRKAAATRAAENGASHQLMAMFGWLTLKQAELYTRLAERARLSETGMDTLARRNKAGARCLPPLAGSVFHPD